MRSPAPLPDANRRTRNASAGHPGPTQPSTGRARPGLLQYHRAAPKCAPENIKITDNALIPMKERVADRKYDPVVWLGSKLFRR